MQNLIAPFAAYKGNEPYIFISYAHASSERVFAHITRLHEAGFRIWYDEGIDPGTDWSDEIALALNNAAALLVFMSPEAAHSHNVKKEIVFGLSKRKQMVCVHIQETELPLGLELQLGDIQAILEARYNDKNKFYERLMNALPAQTRVSRPAEILAPQPAPIAPFAPVSRELAQPPFASPTPAASGVSAFVARGTATIIMQDGTTHTAVANSLLLKCASFTGGITSQFYPGLDEQSDKTGYHTEGLIHFADMLEFSVTGGSTGRSFLITDCDNEQQTKQLTDTSAELWAISQDRQRFMTVLPVTQVARVTFDWRSTPGYAVPMTLIERVNYDSLLVPRAFLMFLIGDLSQGSPRFSWSTALPLRQNGGVPLMRVRTITVNKVIREARLYQPITEVELTVEKRNGEQLQDRICISLTMHVLTGAGLATPALESVRRIILDYPTT